MLTTCCPQVALSPIVTACKQARRATAGPGKPLSRGPIVYHNLILYASRSREETWEGCPPHHLTRDLGSIVSSPNGIQDGTLAKNDKNGFYHRRRRRGQGGGVCVPLKFGQKYLSGNYYVKFGQKYKIREFC